jgi:hypothetical protein
MHATEKSTTAHVHPQQGDADFTFHYLGPQEKSPFVSLHTTAVATEQERERERRQTKKNIKHQPTPPPGQAKQADKKRATHERAARHEKLQAPGIKL